MKLGANGGFTKITKSAGFIQWIICWWPKTRGDEIKPWKVSKLQRQGLVPMFIPQAHFPTDRCSKSQRCVKPWTAESQVKKGVVRRYKLWRRHLHPSNLCEKLWPLTWTCQYKHDTKFPVLWCTRNVKYMLPETCWKQCKRQLGSSLFIWFGHCMLGYMYDLPRERNWVSTRRTCSGSPRWCRRTGPLRKGWEN